MKKTMKKIIATILTAAMAISVGMPAFAAENVKINENNIVREQIDVEKVDLLIEKYNIPICDSSTRQSIIEKIETLSRGDLAFEDVEKSRLEGLPIIEVSYEDIMVLYGEKAVSTRNTPSVPGDSFGVHYYPIRSQVTISNTTYNVFEIIASAKDTEGTLSSNNQFKLINSNSITKDMLNKSFSAATSVAGYFYSNASLLSYLTGFKNASSGTGTEINVVAQTTQIMDYAYVNTGNVPYDLMLTTQKISLSDTYTLNWVRSGIAQTPDVYNITAAKASQYFADVNRPALLYSNGNRTGEAYSVTTSIKYYFDGVVKKSISVPWYPTLGSLPN